MRNDPKAAAALSGISLHSRQALDELRATVGLLRGLSGLAGLDAGLLQLGAGFIPLR